jgi:hypothetical protein
LPTAEAERRTRWVDDGALIGLAQERLPYPEKAATGPNGVLADAGRREAVPERTWSPCRAEPGARPGHQEPLADQWPVMGCRAGDRGASTPQPGIEVTGPPRAGGRHLRVSAIGALWAAVPALVGNGIGEQAANPGAAHRSSPTPERAFHHPAVSPSSVPRVRRRGFPTALLNRPAAAFSPIDTGKVAVRAAVRTFSYS